MPIMAWVGFVWVRAHTQTNLRFVRFLSNFFTFKFVFMKILFNMIILKLKKYIKSFRVNNTKLIIETRVESVFSQLTQILGVFLQFLFLFLYFLSVISMATGQLWDWINWRSSVTFFFPPIYSFLEFKIVLFLLKGKVKFFFYSLLDHTGFRITLSGFNFVLLASKHEQKSHWINSSKNWW